MTRPLLLDLFCGAGGAAVGYHRAGFDVVGVDIEAQRHYPFEFIRADATSPPVEWERFAAVHASPPCQGYANVTRWRGDQDDHPRLIEPVRAMLEATGLPFVIENVATAALRPCMVLCGSMFGLPIRRHRGFETNWNAFSLLPECRHRSTDLAFMHKHERAYADAMECGWMTAREAREAIPPAYTEHMGHLLMAEVQRRNRMSDFPYMPTTNGCDLCGRSAPLRRVTIAKGGKRKLARVAYGHGRRPCPLAAGAGVLSESAPLSSVAGRGNARGALAGTIPAKAIKPFSRN